MAFLRKQLKTDSVVGARTAPLPLPLPAGTGAAVRLGDRRPRAESSASGGAHNVGSVPTRRSHAERRHVPLSPLQPASSVCGVQPSSAALRPPTFMLINIMISKFVYLREAFCPSLDDEVALLTQVTHDESPLSQPTPAEQLPCCIDATPVHTKAQDTGGGVAVDVDHAVCCGVPCRAAPSGECRRSEPPLSTRVWTPTAHAAPPEPRHAAPNDCQPQAYGIDGRLHVSYALTPAWG